MIFNLFHLCIKSFGDEEQENRKTIDAAFVFVNEETTSFKPLDQVADESSHVLFDIPTSEDEEDVWVLDIDSSDEECHDVVELVVVQPLERKVFTNDYENERKQMTTMTTLYEKNPAPPSREIVAVSSERSDDRNDAAGVLCEENIAIDDVPIIVEEPIDDSTTISVKVGEDEIGPIAAPELEDAVVVVTKEENNMAIETPDHVNDENAEPTMTEHLLGRLSKDIVVGANKHMLRANDDPENKVIVTDDSVIVITKDKVLIVITKDKVFVTKKPTTPGEKAQTVEMKRSPTKKGKSKRSCKKSSSRLEERTTLLSPNKILLLEESQNKTLLGAMQH
jgi:hypothetical protein